MEERNRLADRFGDKTNAIMSAAGMNFRKLLRWVKHSKVSSVKPAQHECAAKNRLLQDRLIAWKRESVNT